MSTRDRRPRHASRIANEPVVLLREDGHARRRALARRGRLFSNALFQWIYGPGAERQRFDRWIDALTALPRRQTRVATWPVATIFGFIARPRVHLYLKPTVTRAAADAYGFDFRYRSTLGWEPYASLLDFVKTLRHDLADLRPRDMVDIQSFIWVLGSEEYPD